MGQEDEGIRHGRGRFAAPERAALPGRGGGKDSHAPAAPRSPDEIVVVEVMPQGFGDAWQA